MPRAGPRAGPRPQRRRRSPARRGRSTTAWHSSPAHGPAGTARVLGALTRENSLPLKCFLSGAEKQRPGCPSPSPSPLRAAQSRSPGPPLQERCPSPAAAPRRAPPGMPVSLLPWAAQDWTQRSRCGLSSAERRGRITSLHLPAALLPGHHLLPLLQGHVGVHQHPQGIFHQAVFQLGGPQCILVDGVVLSVVQDFGLPSIELHEAPAKPISPVRLWTATPPSSVLSATPPSLVPQVGVGRAHTCTGHTPANLGPKAEGYLGPKASLVGHAIILVVWPGGWQGELEAPVDTCSSQHLPVAFGPMALVPTPHPVESDPSCRRQVSLKASPCWILQGTLS